MYILFSQALSTPLVLLSTSFRRRPASVSAWFVELNRAIVAFWTLEAGLKMVRRPLLSYQDCHTCYARHRS